MQSISTGKDYKARASQWEEFLKSDVWYDLQLFIADKVDFQYGRLVMTEDERKVAESMPENDNIIRGRIREASDLLNAPQEILNELQDTEDS
jgi:hypothetical protein